MIRINLLPYRVARRKENIRRQVSVYVLTNIFVLVLMGYFYMNWNSQLESLREKRVEKKKELAQYSEDLKEMKSLKREERSLKKKLRNIQTLEKKRAGPVPLLAEVAEAVPEGKLYLKSLRESSGEVSVQGTAADNDTVASFMTNLEKKEHIDSVYLQSTHLTTLKDKDYEMEVRNFGLSFRYLQESPE